MPKTIITEPETPIIQDELLNEELNRQAPAATQVQAATLAENKAPKTHQPSNVVTLNVM